MRVTEILKALTILDNRGRLALQLARKIQMIEFEHPHLIRLRKDESESDTSEYDSDDKKKCKSHRRKIEMYRGKLRAINNALSEACPDKKSTCIATAHADKAVREDSVSIWRLWCTCTKGSQLGKVYSDERWTQVNYGDKQQSSRKHSGTVHFCPSDFPVSYFMADIHKDPILESCLVARMRALVKAGEESDNVVEDFRVIASEFPQVYLAYPFL
mmetsp:Transcript_13242/g.23954  ORF Transcript_13242/g.23954 Transcript_13242/m.23954 type:complete len:215 (-) Transcript_13242:200-844(-)